MKTPKTTKEQKKTKKTHKKTYNTKKTVGLVFPTLTNCLEQSKASKLILNTPVLIITSLNCPKLDI